MQIQKTIENIIIQKNIYKVYKNRLYANGENLKQDMQYTLVMLSTSTRGKWSTGRALVLRIQSESETNQLYDTIQLI